MAPLAGRAVVGSGLRAFANGQALVEAGHQVAFCTRHEDLPEELRARAERLRGGTDRLLLTSLSTGPVAPPARKRPPAPAGATAPTAQLDAVLAPDGPSEDAEVTRLHPSLRVGEPAPRERGRGWTPSQGLAEVGGPLGAPGNPFAFTDPVELHRICAEVDPDVVLVEALEAARHIPEGRWTVVLDLFAPRLLEQQFQVGSGDEREAVRLFDALQRADQYLFSNDRQKYFHLPLLALAGVDVTGAAGGVVPISCPPDLPPVQKPAVTTFVAGGVFWPWADLRPGLKGLLAALDAHEAGKLRLYGGEYGIRSDTSRYADPRDVLPKDHARLEFAGMVPIDVLWDEYRRASVAFDLMVPNPEREVNLSFRQVDYLRCGLPIITAPTQVIARDLQDYGAGWLIEPDDDAALRRLVGELLSDPSRVAEASANAQRLAREKYSWSVTSGELLAAVEAGVRREHGASLLSRMARTQADLWEEHEGTTRLRERVTRQEAELTAKSAEVASQDAKIRQLLGSVDRLTLSLEEVSRFRTETIQYLQEEQDGSLREAAELQRELDRARLDAKKKQAALTAAERRLDDLKGAVAELEEQNTRLQDRFAARDAEALANAERRRALEDRLRVQQGELDAARREVRVRSEALDELRAEMQRAEGRSLEALASAERSAGAMVRALSERLETAKREAEQRLEATQREADQRLETATDDAKRQLEAARVQAARDRESARIRLDSVAAELTRARDEATALQQELEKKTTELEALHEELGAARRQAEAAEARRLEVDAALDAAVGAAATERASTSARVRSLEQDLEKKTAELVVAQEDAERARREAEEAAIRQREQLSELQSTADAAASDQARLAQRVRELEQDLAKKGSELTATRADARAQLTAQADAAFHELARAREEAAGALRALTARVGELERQRARLSTELAQARQEAADARARLDAERATFEAEAHKAEAERADQQEEARAAERRLEQKLEATARELAASRTRTNEVEGRLREAEFTIEALQGDVRKKSDELEAAERERMALDKKAGRKLAALTRQRDGLETWSAELSARAEQLEYSVSSLQADLAKKSREIEAALRERDRLQLELDAAYASTASIPEVDLDDEPVVPEEPVPVVSLSDPPEA